MGYRMVLIMLFVTGAVHAQNNSFYMSPGLISAQSIVFPDYQAINDSRIDHQKWFVSRYAAISAGTIFYPGASGFAISAPVGLQLNRQLTNNLYAFAGGYVAPTITSFNRSFLSSQTGQFYPGFNQFTVNPGIQMGLMYVNDAGTFSISGSIRAEYNNYPVYTSPPPAQRKK
jgi:hypothetical protein